MRSVSGDSVASVLHQTGELTVNNRLNAKAKLLKILEDSGKDIALCKCDLVVMTDKNPQPSSTTPTLKDRFSTKVLF